MCAPNETKKVNEAFSYLFRTHLAITILMIKVENAWRDGRPQVSMQRFLQRLLASCWYSCISVTTQYNSVRIFDEVVLRIWKLPFSEHDVTPITYNRPSTVAVLW